MIEKINIQKPNKNFPFGKPLPTYYDYILILNFYLLICSCLSMAIGFSSPHPNSNNLWNEIASIDTFERFVANDSLNDSKTGSMSLPKFLYSYKGTSSTGSAK